MLRIAAEASIFMTRFESRKKPNLVLRKFPLISIGGLTSLCFRRHTESKYFRRFHWRQGNRSQRGLVND